MPQTCDKPSSDGMCHGQLCKGLRNRQSAEIHGCPFQEDVHKDLTPMCYCCDDCMTECGDNI
jgi:hypothetical protein